MPIVITAKWLDAQLNKPRDKRIDVVDKSGLGVRISLKGKIVFQFRYKHNRKDGRLDLGEYPATGIKEARDELLKWKAVLSHGDDPRTIQLLDRSEKMKAVTLEEAIRHWFDRYLSRRRKNPEKVIRRFELHVFPELGKLPADKVELHHWLAIFDSLVDAGKHGLVDNLLTEAKQAQAFLRNRQVIKSTPLITLTINELGIVRKIGERVLSDGELATIWGGLSSSALRARNRIMFKLLLLYGCRSQELRLAEKSHFDLDAGIWTVPAELSKNVGRPIKRPIFSAAKELIEEAVSLAGDSPFLFPKKDGHPVTHSAPQSIPESLIRTFGMDHWTLHDLRRTARTNFSLFTGDKPHVAEKMLGHKLGGVWETYDKFDYLDEQQAAYEQWAAKLDSLAAGGNVVLLHRLKA